MAAYKMIRTGPHNFSGQDTQTVDIECPAGFKPVGGGFRVAGTFPKVLGSHPLVSAIDSKDGWRLIVQGQNLDSYTVFAYLVAADLSYDYSV